MNGLAPFCGVQILSAFFVKFYKNLPPLMVFSEIGVTVTAGAWSFSSVIETVTWHSAWRASSPESVASIVKTTLN